MTSSTSSSESRINHTAPDDLRRHHVRRIVALKTVVLGGGVIVLAMLMVNALVAFIRSQVPSPFSIERIQTSAAALPAALALPDNTHPVVYVFGSSLIEFGFSPAVFDARLKDKGIDSVSYNFGFGNSDPNIQQRFAGHFAELFHDQPRKVDLVIYEFAPFQATLRRAQHSGQLDHAAQAAIGDWRDFLEVAKHDHDSAMELFNTRYIRNGVPADAITSLLSVPLKKQSHPAPKIQEDLTPSTSSLSLDFYRKLHQEWFRNQDPGSWREADRGGLPVTASDETMALGAELMARMQNPQRMQRALESRIECCDIEDLNIDETMLGEFIDAIRKAQSVSRRVDVLLMPRNGDIVHLSERGKRNLKAALDRIKADTGVKVVDFSEAPDYGVKWFFDTDHLTLFGGRVRFSQQLADYYARNGL